MQSVCRWCPTSKPPLSKGEDSTLVKNKKRKLINAGNTFFGQMKSN